MKRQRNSEKKPIELTNKQIVKSVHFAYDVHDSQPRSGRYDLTNKPPKCRTILKYLSECEFEKIKSYLKSRPPEIMSKFYQGDCACLFYKAINGMVSAEPLAFLLNYIPREIALNLLSEEEFNMLRCFFHVSSSLDRKQAWTLEEIEHITKKIELLLAWNNESITEAMNTIVQEEDITKGIKECFLKAQHVVNQQRNCFSKTQ